MDQPGKVANPARGQLNREMNILLSLCVPENLVSRDGFSRPVPRQPAHLHVVLRLNLNPMISWTEGKINRSTRAVARDLHYRDRCSNSMINWHVPTAKDS